MFTRKRILILIPIVLITAFTIQLVREMEGPTPEIAFRWVFDNPPPDYATSLKSEFSTHLKGYNLYLGFDVPPTKLGETIDTESSTPLYRPDFDYLERWDHQKVFQKMYPEHLIAVNECRRIVRTTEGQQWIIVYNPTTGRVYCYYCSDSDITLDP